LIWTRRGIVLLIAWSVTIASAGDIEPDKTVGAPPPKGYVCVRARTPVVIDGKLDDRAWTDAPWTDDFVDIEGDAKPRPRFKTRAKMLWDDHFFYGRRRALRA